MAQIAHTRVVAHWSESSPSIELAVDEPVRRSQAHDGVAPVSSIVSDDEGEVTGELLLWIESGKLSGLEFAWYGDLPPDRLPETAKVAVTPDRG
ncbi:hypothetical protein [Streptomyces sp. NPDC006477]|uniref:hypothetical protein n=1 Tax=Streptomyces sp. NPDC006477 TaxID=3364747 RepID=UPI003693867B